MIPGPRRIPGRLDRQALAALLRWRVLLMAGLSTALGALLARASTSGACQALGIGMLLCAGCTVLNQVQERRVDARMLRTRRRPLASGVLSPSTGAALGGALLLAGLTASFAMGGTAALLAAVSVPLIYNGLYTPLKRHSPFAILVGSVPGAMPPVLGWLLAGQSMTQASASSIGALFAVYYLWQVPHFWALAEKRRNDYARAGLAVAPLRMCRRRYGLVHAFWTAAFFVGIAASALLGVVPDTGLRYAVLILALISGLAAVVQFLPKRGGTGPSDWRVADAAMAGFFVLVSVGTFSN
ncbi:MAG: UbiA family prenyltransferase [Desulfovibrio sp.]|nr:UbiA family prenyltransferase [Desulfovibrio sp.]